MKRYFKLIVGFAFLIQTVASAQNYDTRDYDYTAKPALATLSAAESKEPSVLILDKRIMEYIYDDKNNLEMYYTRHRYVHINDQAKVESYNRIYLPVNDPKDLLVLKARSISKDGKVKEMSKADMKKVTEEGNDYLILAVEGLEKGAELEYFYTFKRNPNLFLTEKMQSDVYTRHEELTLISPHNLVFEGKAYNGTVQKSDTTLKDKRYLYITKDNISPLDEEEKYASTQANLLRMEYKLVKNTNNQESRLFTWQDAGRRYFQLYHLQEKDAKRDIEKLASKLNLKGMSQEVQIKTLENFMKTTINIQSTGEDEKISAMLKRNYGSEENVISLYTLMFEYLNIPYEFVVTSNRLQTPFDPDFDTWNYLDKSLFYFPDNKKFMDPANYAYRYGAIPFQYSGTKGLFVKRVAIGDVESGVTTVKQINASSFENNYDNLDADITFNAALDNNTIKLKKIYNGDADNQVRAAYFYAKPEEREKIIKDLLESTSKDMKINSSSMTNYDLTTGDYSKPIILDADVSSSAFIEKAGDNILFLVGDIIGKQAEMYQEHARQNPIEVYFAHSYTRIIKIHVPEGYSMKGLDKLNFNVLGKDDADDAEGFTSSYKQEGNLITITVYEYYKKISMPATAFVDFKKVINASADFNKVKLVLAKN